MIHLQYNNLSLAKDAHYNAILSYVKKKSPEWRNSLYSKIRKILSDFPENWDENDYTWLQYFILAEPHLLESWVLNFPRFLKFKDFYKIYINNFANGTNNFVDSEKTYNAFTLLEMIDFNVCPYCEDEYFDVIEIEEKEKRTCDFDHFHAKNPEKFPALAMCFYNLVPSGKSCNHIKLDDNVSANPYEEDIETQSRFYQATPLGKNLESLSPEEIRIKLEVTGKMIKNNEKLGIEQRYNHRTYELLKLFRIKRDLAPENIKQWESIGLDLKSWLGKTYPQEKGNSLHHKLRYDITGY